MTRVSTGAPPSPPASSPRSASRTTASGTRTPPSVPSTPSASRIRAQREPWGRGFGLAPGDVFASYVVNGRRPLRPPRTKVTRALPTRNHATRAVAQLPVADVGHRPPFLGQLRAAGAH